ncbi:hypothetical protein TNCV_4199021 [Trichonephila clavipes]|nr:hypothetical protein TNCV_4199021 [Trichonephila clavipes]
MLGSKFAASNSLAECSFQMAYVHDCEAKWEDCATGSNYLQRHRCPLSKSWISCFPLGNLFLSSEHPERTLENDSVPIVQSAMVFEMCQSLDIQARLAWEEERIVWIAKSKKRTE